MPARSHRLPLGLIHIAILTGAFGTVLISVPEEPIQGVVGESVLLPVTFTLSYPLTTLRIVWTYKDSIIAFSEMTPCDGSSSPVPRVCQEYSIIMEEYRGRAIFFPQNASLLLRYLRLEDRGQYTITFQELDESKSVVLDVSPAEGDARGTDSIQVPQPEREDASRRHSILSAVVRYTGAAIFLLLIVTLHCVWCRLAE